MQSKMRKTQKLTGLTVSLLRIWQDAQCRGLSSVECGEADSTLFEGNG